MTYRVVFVGPGWVVQKHGEVVARNPTLQAAVQWAKAHAAEDRGRVVWEDRDGNEQGHADYRIREHRPQGESTA